MKGWAYFCWAANFYSACQSSYAKISVCLDAQRLWKDFTASVSSTICRMYYYIFMVLSPFSLFYWTPTSCLPGFLSVFWGVEVLISIFAARPNIHYVAWLKYFQKSNSLVELFSFLTFPFFFFLNLKFKLFLCGVNYHSCLLQYQTIRRHLAELFYFRKSTESGCTTLLHIDAWRLVCVGFYPFMVLFHKHVQELIKWKSVVFFVSREISRLYGVGFGLWKLCGLIFPLNWSSVVSPTQQFIPEGLDRNCVCRRLDPYTVRFHGNVQHQSSTLFLFPVCCFSGWWQCCH